MMMNEVEVKVLIREIGSIETEGKRPRLTVRSHPIRGNMVVLQTPDHYQLSFVASELIQAIERCRE